MHPWEVGKAELGEGVSSHMLERVFEQILSDNASLWLLQLSHHKCTKIDWILGFISQVQT